MSDTFALAALCYLALPCVLTGPITMTESVSSTERFSDRVRDYTRARPTYPAAVLERLTQAGLLAPGAAVADVGAGTGISSRLFLEAGYAVTAVEPNAAMRAAAETELGPRYPAFRAVDGTAEATGLADASVNLVVVAQALHWMDIDRCHREFRRILRRDGGLAVLYNTRDNETDGFMRGYEALVRRFSADYEHVRHENLTPGVFARIFGTRDYAGARFANPQRTDWEGCLARARSSSYLPAENSPNYPDMVEALSQLFDANARDGRVNFEYVTELYWSRVK